jgi:hypothetical protein
VIVARADNRVDSSQSKHGAARQFLWVLKLKAARATVRELMRKLKAPQRIRW